LTEVFVIITIWTRSQTMILSLLARVCFTQTMVSFIPTIVFVSITMASLRETGVFTSQSLGFDSDTG